MVVSSSTFASGTSTTNALGQHHVQSFPTTFKSPVDEKKADDQRVVNLKVEEEKRSRWKKEEYVHNAHTIDTCQYNLRCAFDQNKINCF